MKQDVSKNTVRFLSEQTTGSVNPDLSPPSNDFFIQKIKNRYAVLKAQTEINMLSVESNKKVKKDIVLKEKYKFRLDQFKQVISKIPDEFSLAATMYTRITVEQNKKIKEEFSTYVRPRFMIFLAEQHSKDLKKMGLCDNSINRMKSGLDPSDRDGLFYNLTVDHIIECSGSGEFGYDKSYDKKTSQYMRPTYKVNHFSNLIFLPDNIHSGIKNIINDIQNLPSMESKQAQWSISLIPTGSNIAECSLYVPKTKEAVKHFIHKGKRRTRTKISKISYLEKQLDVEATLYLEFFKTGSIDGKDIKLKKIKKNRLAKAFNGREQSEYIYKRRIKPLLKEMTDILDSIDKDLSAKRLKNKEIKILTGQLNQVLGSLSLTHTENKVQDVAKLVGENTGLKFKHKKEFLLDKHCRTPKLRYPNNNHK